MSKVIAFDTETRGLDWFDPDQQAFLASWADEDGEYVADLSDAEQVKTFIDALESADVLVCHNFSFDCHMVRETLGWDALTSGKELHDTDLMSRVLRPEGQRKGDRGGHGLKNLAQTFLDPGAKQYEDHIAEMAKAIGLRTLKQNGAYYEVWRAYPDVMERYAAMDARFTYDLYMKFRDEDNPLWKIYELERAVAPILIEAERIGVSIDLDAAAALRDEYEPQEQELHAHLIEVLGDVLEGDGSRDGLRDALLEHGIPLYRTTDAGLLRADKFALQEFEGDYPIIGELMEWRRLVRFRDTYLGPMLASGGTLHTSFRQCEAWTGRMSSARPNMQNLPKRAGKEVRRPLIPRDGYCFVVTDYEGIEARLLAYYMADENYKQFFRDGRDPHAWMASEIHGGDPVEFGKETEKREVRDEAKNTLFAITYGAGGRRVTDMNKLDPGPFWDEEHPAIVAAREEGRWWPKPGYQYKEGRALIRKIKSALPRYARLNSRIKKKVEAEGHVNTLFGRKQVVNKDKSYVGLNAVIQGSAADLMKQGLINAAVAIRDLGAYPILVIHDEIVTECPIENAEECLTRQSAAMIAAYDLDPPLAVEGSIVTTNYSEA